MRETKVAKLFKNGASQAVRLPADCRFEGDEVYVTKDDVTGDLLLSGYPGAVWRSFFEMIHSIETLDDFMSDRPMNVLPRETGLFGDSDQ